MIKNSLRKELLLSSFLSILLAIATFVICLILLTLLGDFILGTNSYGTKVANRQKQSLEAFISENEITLDNINDLDIWYEEHQSSTSFFLHDGKTIVYDYYHGFTFFVDPDEPLEVNEYQYNLNLADGTPVYLQLTIYPEDSYYIFSIVISIILGAIIFTIVFISLVSKKTLYIQQMKKDLDILSDGDLSHNISVSGTDELTVLAEGINKMKNTIIEKQYSEEQARKANVDLVTAISHDLRSPLTALIGYLEILNRQKFASAEQESYFVENSLKKATQIKAMTDQLFEYFLVHSTEWNDMEKELFQSEQFFKDAIREYIDAFEIAGFTIQADIEPELPGFTMLNANLIKRVFDNLYSNITKYADKGSPLLVRASHDEDYLILECENRIRSIPNKKDSTQIGLKTCEHIMKFHNGRFVIQMDDENFVVSLYFSYTK